MSSYYITELVEARDLAEVGRESDIDNDPGLICGECFTTWCKVARLRGLADLDCPRCGAIYSSIAWNVEP